MFGFGKKKMAAPKEGPTGMLGGVQRSLSDPPKRGTLEHLQVFEASPWPRAVGEKVSNAVACCGYEVHRLTRDGKTVRDSRLQKAEPETRLRLMKEKAANLEQMERHPFLDALDAPNPFMDRMALLKITELHVDFVGDAFWLKERGALGQPTGYWPIPPQWVMEYPRPDKPTFRFGYRGWQAIVPASEVGWLHEAAPANPYTRGTGIGWALADEVQVDEYAAKMASAFFFNRARPDFVFATGLQQDETARLEQEWLNRNQGFWRAHRPFFLHGDPDAVDLQKQIREFQQPTMEQLVYPGLRKVQRDIILQTWGVAPELFGIVENSNRATIEAAEYLFSKYVTWPKAERMRAFLQRLFIEDFDERGIVHTPSPVMEDKTFRLDAMKAAPWAYTVDEFRAVGGHAPVGNGVGGSRMIPLASYLTNDPLNPALRPAAGGSVPKPALDAPKDDPDEDPKGVTLHLDGRYYRALTAGEKD